MALETLIPTLQIAVGPVILISGIGLLMLSMTNRLARVVDRSRELIATRRTAGKDETESSDQQLSILWKRAHLLRAAIAFSAASVLCVCLLILMLFVGPLMEWNTTLWIVLLFAGCIISVIVSLLFFLRDINLSLHALAREMVVVDNDR